MKRIIWFISESYMKCNALLMYIDVGHIRSSRGYVVTEDHPSFMFLVVLQGYYQPNLEILFAFPNWKFPNKEKTWFMSFRFIFPKFLIFLDINHIYFDGQLDRNWWQSVLVTSLRYWNCHHIVEKTCFMDLKAEEFSLRLRNNSSFE